MATDLVVSAKRAFEAGHIEAAWAQINTALNDQWERPDALYIAGLIMREKGNIALAAQLFRRALATEQQKVNLWMHYGACLHDMHLYDDARQVFELVQAQLPTDPQPIANIASGYVQQGKLREAINKANEALALSPTNVIARIAKGYGCLGLGRWKDAWEHVEALYGEHVGVRIYNAKENAEPEWDGTKGKTVVVTADQGVGDIIMFSQCLDQMARDCEQVIVDCSPRMVPVLQRAFPKVHVYGTISQYNMSWLRDYQIDARINISYLGRFYRNKDADFPRKPYLVPDAALQEKWRKWLEQFPRPWVGLAWEGGLVHTQKSSRSVPLEAYKPILEMGGTFIDMGYREAWAEIAKWNIENDAQVVYPWLDDTNLDDTIALASVLDEVITVTTALAHICGALGRQASVLVPTVAQWRYQHRCGDGMIWYPEGSVKLYRQAHGEDSFAPAIARIVKDRAKELKKAA